jgi:hypothetical protein
MRRVWWFALLLAPFAASAAEKPCRAPIWTVDIASTFSFRPYGLVKHPRNQPPLAWRTQQAVVFTAPDTLAIYQVKESEGGHPLEPQDASGGGGRYVLEIVFLDRAKGKEIHRLRLTTGSTGQSAVYPTHDGRFLVVTGKMLRLFSPTFQEIASRPGPIGQSGQSQYWRVSVIPPGKRIFAYVDITMPFLLDADTLDTIPSPKPSDVALWWEGSRLFKELRGDGPGAFSPEGNWLTLAVDPRASGRAYWVFLNISSQGSGGWDSKEIKLFSPSGQLIWDIQTRDDIYGYVSNGSLLAAGIYHTRADPLDLGLAAKPRWVAIYDLERKSQRCAIPIAGVVSGGWNARFYDLSSTGSVAIAQQNLLSLYEP